MIEPNRTTYDRIVTNSRLHSGYESGGGIRFLKENSRVKVGYNVMNGKQVVIEEYCEGPGDLVSEVEGCEERAR